MDSLCDVHVSLVVREQHRRGRCRRWNELCGEGATGTSSQAKAIIASVGNVHWHVVRVSGDKVRER